ncbi:MAG: cell division protein FtsB, partial [Lysobacterales bacterium]
VTLILLILFVLLQFRLWLGEGGFREVARLETRVENQRQKNEDLLQRNAELQAEVEDLRDRLDAVEERARNELGLIKPNEEFYQVVPPPPGNLQTEEKNGEGT